MGARGEWAGRRFEGLEGGKTRPVADVLARNGSCVGKFPDPTRPEWNPLTHGDYLPTQNSITCVDSYSCLEFTKRGVTLRLCFPFTLRAAPLLMATPSYRSRSSAVEPVRPRPCGRCRPTLGL